jgi:ATP-dependent Clp protease ATP-binding subunit ClpA
MDLSRLDANARSRIARDYQSAGVVSLTSVRLPDAFVVQEADVVLVRVDGRCEVHLGATARYRGELPQWQAIDAGVELHGARLVTTVDGDGQAGLRELERLLDLARAEEADQPLPKTPAARRQHSTGLQDLVAAERNQPRPFAGREDLLPVITANLCRAEKPGIVLLGAPGVGKTTLVHMLAWQLAHDGNVPRALRDVPILDLPLGNLSEDAARIGGLERKTRHLCEQPGRPIFFVDEIHQLGRQELAPLRDLLKPALADGRIRVLAATTLDEWRQLDDEAFKRRFAELRVPEPSSAETAQMVGARVHRLATHHGLDIDERTMREAILLADRHLPLRTFPDKALDVLDQGAALQSLAGGSKRLESQQLYAAVARLAGVSPELVDPRAGPQLIARVDHRLRRKLRGQDSAFDQLAATLTGRLAVSHLGWDEAVRTLDRPRDRRPLATLLACGPTGVGKTETARVLADELFGGHLILLNGSDVGPEAPHGISAWVGSPPGYVGSHRGGTLTRGLRESPAALICVDELEKASPEAVQNVLLPLLGDGVVTDRNDGRTVWASACVVVCTSNLPVPDGDADDVFAALRPYLRPEVVARFHAVLRYKPLDLDSKWRLWSDLREDLQVRTGVRIHLDDVARNHVQERFAGLQARGARGIEHLFTDEVVPLVLGLATGETLAVTVVEGKLGRGVEEA